MARRSFTLELLQEVIKRDGATLVGEYDSNLTCHTVINFNCNCGQIHKKKFTSLVDCNGAVCKKCSNEMKQEKTVNTNKERLGVERPAQNREVHNKMTETVRNKYGSDNVFQNQTIKEKIKKTLIKKLGVHHPSQSNEIKSKKIETSLKNHGVSNPSQSTSVKAKKIQTSRINHGVDYPMQSESVKEKSKETSRQNYGVDYPNQSQEFQAQNQHKAYKRKEFVMPSGDIRSVQGSEPFALRDLLGAGYTEDQIKTTRQDIPRIQYDCNGKQRYYFPDIFLPHENKLIEVKSTWTYKTDWDKKLKYQKDAVEKQGYTYEIWIYNAKGVQVQSGNLLAR